MSLKPHEMFEALERGEVVEVSINCEEPQWGRWNGNSWYSHCEYRIAPKKLSLVERIRNGLKAHCLLDMDDVKAAADRIEELERYEAQCKTLNYLPYVEIDTLLAEIKRRVE